MRTHGCVLLRGHIGDHACSLPDCPPAPAASEPPEAGEPSIYESAKRIGTAEPTYDPILARLDFIVSGVDVLLKALPEPPPESAPLPAQPATVRCDCVPGLAEGCWVTARRRVTGGRVPCDCPCHSGQPLPAQPSREGEALSALWIKHAQEAQKCLQEALGSYNQENPWLGICAAVALLLPEKFNNPRAERPRDVESAARLEDNAIWRAWDELRVAYGTEAWIRADPDRRSAAYQVFYRFVREVERAALSEPGTAKGGR